MADTKSPAAPAARRALPGGFCAGCATSPWWRDRARSTQKIADAALTRLEVDQAGLDSLDRRYLNQIARNFGGGPVGIETIAAALSEPRDAIEDIIEPYLIQQGLIQRTPRGRIMTVNAWKHLGLEAPRDLIAVQGRLFEEE